MRLINEIFLLLYLVYKRLNIFQQVKKLFKKLIFIFGIIFVLYGRAFLFVAFLFAILSAAGIIPDWLGVLLTFASALIFIINLCRGV